jgi:hypothetical protein
MIYASELKAHYARVRRRLDVIRARRRPAPRKKWHQPRVRDITNRKYACRGWGADQAKPHITRLLEALKHYDLPNCADVIREVAHEFNLDADALAGRSQAWDLSHPRQIAMALCVVRLGLGLSQVARRFGRHHTTVMFAVRKWGDVVGKE